MKLEMMVVPVVLALVAGAFSIWSRFTGARSGKFGLVALAYGAVALIPVFLAPHFREYAKVQILLFCGVGALFFAVLALLLGLMGFRARSREGGKGGVWAICGLISGMINLLLGLGIVAVGVGS